MKKLTKAEIAATADGRILKDHVVTGLEIRCGAQVKAWRLYYRDKAGTQRRATLGRFPAMALESARETAREMLVQIALGANPSKERQAKRAEPTVAELIDQYTERKLPTLSPDGQINAEKSFRLYIRPKFGFEKATEVGQGEIIRFMQEIADRKYRPTTAKSKRQTGGKAAANHALTYFSSLYTWSTGLGVALLPPGTPNPCKGVAHQKMRKRRRHGTPEELPRIFRAMRELANTYPQEIACITIMFICGTRVNELAKAKWAQVQNGALVLEEHKSDDDTQDVRPIYLPAQVQALLAQLPVCNSGFIFGPRVGKWGRTRIWKIWNIVRQIADCPDLRPQDARRTFATLAKSAGASLDQIGELLTHADPETTRRYAWLFDDKARELAQATADGLFALVDKPVIDGRREPHGGLADCSTAQPVAAVLNGPRKQRRAANKTFARRVIMLRPKSE